MLVHIGGEVVLRSREIVGVFDLQTVAQAPITKEFVDLAKSEGTIVDFSGGNPKSLVLTADRVYLSTVSISTIRKRATVNPGTDDSE